MKLRLEIRLRLFNNPGIRSTNRLPDYVKPMVFAGVFPIENEDFENLREALEKLQLNDASWFLNLKRPLHWDLVFVVDFWACCIWRLFRNDCHREFNQEVITTVPNVSYYATKIKGKERIVVNTPSELPEPNYLEFVEEPCIHAQIISKPEFIGAIMTLCLDKRGILKKQSYLNPGTSRADI